MYEKQLREYLGQIGAIANLQLGQSHKTGASKGYAFSMGKMERPNMDDLDAEEDSDDEDLSELEWKRKIAGTLLLQQWRACKITYRMSTTTTIGRKNRKIYVEENHL